MIQCRKYSVWVTRSECESIWNLKQLRLTCRPRRGACCVPIDIESPARTQPTLCWFRCFYQAEKKRNKTENFMNEKRAIYKEPFIHVFLFIFSASLFTFQIYKWFLNIYECCLTLFTRSRFFGASFFSPFRKLKRNRKKKGEAQRRKKKLEWIFVG